MADMASEHRHVAGEVASSSCPRCVAMAARLRAGQIPLAACVHTSLVEITQLGDPRRRMLWIACPNCGGSGRLDDGDVGEPCFRCREDGRIEACGARAIFWPDVEACEAECIRPRDHPGTEHEDETLGTWTEDELPTAPAAS